jgi:hypothetical protein
MRSFIPVERDTPPSKKFRLASASDDTIVAAIGVLRRTDAGAEL